jgi:hypothetical protein
MLAIVLGALLVEADKRWGKSPKSKTTFAENHQ